MNVNNPSVIVYGKSGCGKSTNAERMRAHFGLKRIVDDFDPRGSADMCDVLYLTADLRALKIRKPGNFIRTLAYDAVMADIDAATPAKAGPPLTDWISCTTPPVREGEYEVEALRYGDKPWRATYRDGKWFTAESSTFVKVGQSMDDTMAHPENYRWRGVRRWVLVQRNEPILGRDAYIEHRTPQNTKWTAELAQAKGFDTEAKAMAYRYHGRWPFGLAKIEAVLP